MKVFQILALLLVVAVQYGNAAVEPMQYLPPELQLYLDDCHFSGDLRNYSGQMVLWSSMQLYVSKFAEKESNLTIPETKLFESTLYEVLKPLLYPVARRKRQTSGSDFRIRREIRSLSFGERHRYFDAVNRMKRDTRLSPNVYDVIAGIHRGPNVRRSHMGPAFPSWHRLYLYIFESILRLWYDSSVTVPFWASVLDQRMFDPTWSAIWSDDFFGEGFGVVRNGPFGDWRFLPGPQIIRNFGGGPLMTQAGVDRVLNRTYNFEILRPTASPDSDLEIMHGGTHAFIGGTQNNLNNAAFDPVFFSHHAFIDYIWELFRLQQLSYNINPETDYYFDPTDRRFRPEHDPNTNAGFISIGGVSVLGIQGTDFTQRVGYSNVFFDLVQYIDTPECPDCQGSPFLYCQPDLGVCVARTEEETRGIDTPTTTASSNASVTTPGTPQNPSVTTAASSNTSATTPGTPQFSSTTQPSTVNTTQTTQMPTQSRVTAQPTTVPKNNVPSHTGKSCGTRPLINDVDTKQMGGTGEWAFIPVNVVSKRPDTITGYTDYSLYKAKAKWANQTSLGFKYEFTKSGGQYEFEGCSNMQGTVGKISVVSWGINYDGYAQEYVIADNRFGVSQGNGFLPVKRPTANNPSEFITVAYDSCGRVCKPYSSDKKHANLNAHFGGGFRVTIDSPKQYANSYEEAMLSMWEIASPSFSPVIDYGDIPITFFCEYTDDWIWDKPPPPPMTKQTPTSYKQTTPPSTSPPPTTTQTPTSYNQMPTNYGPEYAVPSYPVSYRDSNAQYCAVANDCIIDGQCGGCTDFDYKYCKGKKKIAICIYGMYKNTATTTAYIKHFYGDFGAML